jgi:tryptophan synthase beta chain
MAAPSAPAQATGTTPDALGRFGAFGGRFVPETLMDALNRLAEAYEEARRDPAFRARLEDYLANYVGRPSPCSSPSG